jgi:holliday junction DNA helicase RuvA
MYEYISGNITELTPTHLVIENSGTGYFVNISLNTYSALNGKKTSRIFLHQVIREDAHMLFGFSDREERDLFRLLITVSGYRCQYCKSNAVITFTRRNCQGNSRWKYRCFERG